LHRDRNADLGLLDGFPLALGASGRSSITLYDLDGDADGRLEIIAADSAAGVIVLKWSAADGAYKMMDGFPVDVFEFAGMGGASDVTLSHPAVADLYGDGEPQIVVATYSGAVLAIHRNGMAHLGEGGLPDPLLPGFPAHTKTPDNSSPDAFGHGRAFLGSPVLADLDKDGLKEIIIGSYDGNVYAWKPVDADADGEVDPADGFPVFCKSEAGAVPADKVCNREDERFAPQIITTPAVGVLDPDSADPDIADYPSILVGTSEVCEDYLAGLKGTRFYAIYHDGAANKAGSPFVPGFPVKMFGPLADALPLPPVAIGITSSPALAHFDGKTYIGVGSAIWFPQLIELQGRRTKVHNMISAPGFNALAHGSFARLGADDTLHYLLPISSILDVIDGWISLLKPMLAAWPLDDLQRTSIEYAQHDCNWYSSVTVADISGDGLPEAILGTGGFTVDAVDVEGQQPPTWPKFTNQWSASAATVGDADGDGLLEVYQPTIEGSLFAWRTLGQTCGTDGAASDWWTASHDERNTGTYGVDTQPPSVVADLTVEEATGGYRLSFTAPGDDWRCGTPAKYDIRWATSRDALIGAAAFRAAKSIPKADIPDPVPGGEPVETIASLSGEDLWFAVQTTDKAGNRSLVSEPAAISGTPDDDDNDNDNDNDDNADDDDNDDGAHGNGGDDDDSGGCGC
jgi:hypothetical protein